MFDSPSNVISTKLAYITGIGDNSEIIINQNKDVLDETSSNISYFHGVYFSTNGELDVPASTELTILKYQLQIRDAGGFCKALRVPTTDKVLKWDGIPLYDGQRLQDETAGPEYYKLSLTLNPSNHTATINGIGGLSDAAAINIPAEVFNVADEAIYKITAIGEEAFSGQSSLESIIVPETLRTMGNNAFNNCSNLASIQYTGDLAQ